MSKRKITSTRKPRKTTRGQPLTKSQVYILTAVFGDGWQQMKPEAILAYLEQVKEHSHIQPSSQ